MLDERRLRGDLLLDVDRILCRTSSDAGAVLLLLRMEYLDEEFDEEVALDICSDISLLYIYMHMCIAEYDTNGYLTREKPKEYGTKSRNRSILRIPLPLRTIEIHRMR